MCKHAWATFIYHIWMQQNAGVHNDLIHCRDGIIWLIKNDVGARTEACKRVLCCLAIGSFSLNIFWLGQSQNVSLAHSSSISLLRILGPLAHKSFFSFFLFFWYKPTSLDFTYHALKPMKSYCTVYTQLLLWPASNNQVSLTAHFDLKHCNHITYFYGNQNSKAINGLHASLQHYLFIIIYDKI